MCIVVAVYISIHVRCDQKVPLHMWAQLSNLDKQLMKFKYLDHCPNVYMSQYQYSILFICYVDTSYQHFLALYYFSSFLN